MDATVIFLLIYIIEDSDLTYCSCVDLERVHGFSLGDSTDDWERKKWQDFKSRLSMVR